MKSEPLFQVRNKKATNVQEVQRSTWGADRGGPGGGGGQPEEGLLCKAHGDSAAAKVGLAQEREGFLPHQQSPQSAGIPEYLVVRQHLAPSPHHLSHHLS